ncbi:uncharacterized protein LAJ45_03518 [Morchella importuna]|uniref:uncharacterized protein n=1 Tax=Morchella importuna TaxID=1174673 RepID=UPI001E8E852A|nr:uncharacterized protein LAJ45_03518 [Morchella importuna]KAH8152677.1 hypothetical protein LAJ45_03518 [Morchella importuna]
MGWGESVVSHFPIKPVRAQALRFTGKPFGTVLYWTHTGDKAVPKLPPVALETESVSAPILRSDFAGGNPGW